MSRSGAYRMIRRRAIDAGVSASVSCHSFRATGITVYLENNGTLEPAQKIAAHESPRTTDRTCSNLISAANVHCPALAASLFLQVLTFTI
jgi:integrase